MGTKFSDIWACGDISLSIYHNGVPVTSIMLQANSTSPIIQITTHLVYLASTNWWTKTQGFSHGILLWIYQIQNWRKLETEEDYWSKDIFANYLNVRSKWSILKYLKSTSWVRHLVNDFYESSMKVLAFMFHENTDLGLVANLYRGVLSLVFTLICYQ